MNGDGKNLTQRGEDAQAIAPMEAEVQRAGLLRVVWERRWIVFAATIVCLAGGFAYLVKATPIYTSTGRLYVEQRGPRIISETEGVMAESKNFLYTQCELLRCTPILASALEQPGLKRMRTFGGVDNPIGLLKKVLDASVGKKDDIINVSFDSPYPQEAARIVNAVVDAYVTYHGKQKRTTAAEVLKILQREKAKRDDELSGRLKEMLEFKRKNGTVSFEKEEGNIVLQRLAKLSGALTTAELDTVNAKVTYEAAKAIMDDPAKVKQLLEAQRAGAVYISMGDEDAQLRQRLRAARERLAELAGDYGPEHPALEAGRANVAQLEKELAEQERRLAEAYVAAAEQQYVMAKKREQQLGESCREQETLAQEVNVKAAEYAMLQSDLKRTERLSDIIDDRIKEINVTEDAGALNINILEVAKPAASPSKPQKARTMAIALVLGLMLGVGGALLRDWMDQRLRSAEEITATLGTPVLGVVPHMVGKHASIADRGRRVHLDPKSHAAEAYRTVRTAVYFGVPDGDAKTLLVTSPGAGDGKTTLVSNLAIAMAQAGQRTLVLDADFRKPMQHEIFQVSGEKGLSHVLAGRGGLEEVVQPTEIENLEVLPCGPVPPNPSEMLNSRAFTALLEKLSSRYEHIVLDSPPVMPVADARILGAMCDVTVLVLRAEKSTRRAAEQARDGLLSVGSHILGAVVNAVPRRRGRYGYYGYYGGYRYYYGYGYGRRSREKEAPEDAAAEKAVTSSKE